MPVRFDELFLAWIAAEEPLKDIGFLSDKSWGFVVIFSFTGSSRSIRKVYDLSFICCVDSSSLTVYTTDPLWIMDHCLFHVNY